MTVAVRTTEAGVTVDTVESASAAIANVFSIENLVVLAHASMDFHTSNANEKHMDSSLISTVFAKIEQTRWFVRRTHSNIRCTNFSVHCHNSG